jgi:hypothetical protein
MGTAAQRTLLFADLHFAASLALEKMQNNERTSARKSGTDASDSPRSAPPVQPPTPITSVLERIDRTANS